MKKHYHLNRHVFVLVSQRGAVPVFCVNSKRKVLVLLARFDYTIGPCLVYRGDIDKSKRLVNVTKEFAALVVRARAKLVTNGREEIPDDYEVWNDPALDEVKYLKVK